jgi:hypothetical protein
MQESGMAGKSPIVAGAAKRQALVELSQSHDRGEADRALLLTLSGMGEPSRRRSLWGREDMVRLWRSLFGTAGVAIGGSQVCQAYASRAKVFDFLGVPDGI